MTGNTAWTAVRDPMTFPRPVRFLLSPTTHLTVCELLVVVKLVGPGIASGGRSWCTVVGMSGTSNSLPCGTTILLACKFALQWCGEAQSAGAGMELAGSGVVI